MKMKTENNVLISSANLDYDVLDDEDYCFEKVDALVEAILRGHEYHSACAFAQIEEEKLSKWLAMDKRFKTLIAWANACYYDYILTCLKDKMESNAQVPVKVLGDYRKREMDKAVSDDVASELLDILNNLEDIDDN